MKRRQLTPDVLESKPQQGFGFMNQKYLQAGFSFTHMK